MFRYRLTTSWGEYKNWSVYPVKGPRYAEQSHRVNGPALSWVADGHRHRRGVYYLHGNRFLGKAMYDAALNEWLQAEEE